MEIKKITMPKDKAKAEWKKYNELLKTKKARYLEDMKKAMYQLKEGKELIDLYVVMEKVGLDKEQNPKLAIARADWSNVYFRKLDDGRGFYSQDGTTWYQKAKGDFTVPPNTFMKWTRTKDKEGKDTWTIENQDAKTKVPIIPATLQPDGELKNYYILWEVEQWANVPPPKDDPILLKRITENLFVILACWDVTDLEQSIIRGL